MIRRPPRSTLDRSSAASDVYKRQSLDHDAEVLVRKADAGADFAITQFFFTREAYVDLRDRVIARGRDLPIIPGLMPVTNVRQLARMTQLSGQPVPRAVTERLERVADDPVACLLYTSDAADERS